MRNKRIAILCGHHGIGTGASANGVDEFKENAYCSAALMMRLADKDYDCMIVCAEQLGNRAEMYKLWKPDIMISLHHNAFTDSSARGGELLYCGEASKKLAEALEGPLKDELGLPWRGLKRRSGLKVLKDAEALQIPAVIVEGGFLTNLQDAVHIQHPTWPDRVATALYGGLEAWFETHPIYEYD